MNASVALKPKLNSPAKKRHSVNYVEQFIKTQSSEFDYHKKTPSEATLTEIRLQTLLNALPAGVVVVDGEGIVNEYNPAAIELLGEPLLGESWRDVIAQSFKSISSGQDLITIDNRIVTISTCPLGGDFSGQIILLQDVTSDRQMQLQLEQHKRLATMGKMAAQLAHQIRTPIASALLYASHLKKSNLSEEHRIKFADKVLNRIKNLEKLIKDMLLFSKNGLDQADHINLDEFLIELQNEFSHHERVNIEFHNDLIGEKIITGNRHLLMSSLTNLIENAIQASDKNTDELNGDTTIQIRAQVSINTKQVSNEMVDFVISDNGGGISQKIKNRIFDPFFTTKDSGTGLGLAVVKAITQAHQGDVWIDKTSKKGSVFIMRLPLTE